MGILINIFLQIAFAIVMIVLQIVFTILWFVVKLLFKLVKKIVVLLCTGIAAVFRYFFLSNAELV